MTPLPDAKRAARAEALAVRARAHDGGIGAARRAAGHALEALGGTAGPGRTIAAYLAIRSEIDAMPLMLTLAGLGAQVALPVIPGRGQPLAFRAWRPGAAMADGPFGTSVPRDGAEVEPDVLIVPMLAFDARCHRLGYGGGFYDRTIAGLRARGPVLALGLAYAAQQLPLLPVEATDMQLDAVATEAGVIRPE
ncbi:MAG: 5-formyltetrahydrofolate cyclo-ligase [Amaricoccus sp.]|uniref:5-formyltetrahydrofolate cyclo-ligase n=1 Tax=Amaricoccus sp. TaxID=1872485 RepID=UPI0039E6FCFF